MDDSIWFYIIAAVIYFLTRGKKKQNPNKSNRPSTASQRPKQTEREVTFEDLLKEVTGQRRESEEVVARSRKELADRDRGFGKGDEQIQIPEEGRDRFFADEESKKVYEESVKLAEGYEIDYGPDDDFRSNKMFKGYEKPSGKRRKSGLAAEIRKGLKDANAAKKAIIYSEILKKRY